MEKLTDSELIEVYLRAKELNCSPEFIQLLFDEIEKRNLEKTNDELHLNFSTS